MIELGLIKLNDKVYVSDPCYEVGTWCQTLLDNVLPGNYRCFITKADLQEWGDRVSELWITHEEYQSIPEEYIGNIGVDAGMAGIYDKEYFETFNTDKHSNPKHGPWYDKVFTTLVMSEDIEGSVMDDKCVVSFSGIGDGSYPVYITRNEEEKIISIGIRFLEFDETSE